MSDLIAALDSALAVAGEDIVLRRVVGTGANVANVDVICRAREDAVSAQDIAAGMKAINIKLILSPTQINNAQWPGGSFAQLPPFNVDQRIPRANGPDKAIVRGQLRQVTFAKPFIIGGELVRIEIQVTG